MNEEEKRNAIEAIKNGFEQNFVWGLDKLQPDSKYRHLQVRGKIVYAEDFRPVTATYINSNISKNLEPSKNFRTLIEEKKNELKLNNKEKY